MVRAGGVEVVERDGLIADQPGLAIDGSGVKTSRIHVALGAGDEEAACLIEPIQAREVEVAAIHDVEGARLGQQQIEHVDVVQLAVGDVDKAGNRAPQVEQRVQLHGGLGRTERPREHRQAQIDGRGIECVNGMVEFHAEAVLSIESARPGDQTLGELGVDAPVACFVCIGERGAAHRFAKAHVVELAGLSRETRLDVAQALSVGELRERHHAKLFRAGERAGSMIAAVALHDALEARPRQEIHDLCEQRLAGIHARCSGDEPRELRRPTAPCSSRHHPKSCKYLHQINALWAQTKRLTGQ